MNEISLRQVGQVVKLPLLEVCSIIWERNN